MRTCYLHLGMGKTGSTAIQDAIDGFGDGRTRTLSLLARNHSVPLMNLYGPDPASHPTNLFAGRKGDALVDYIDDLRATFQAQLDDPQRRNLIISAEALSGKFKDGAAATLVGDLRPWFDRLVGLIYVRDLASLLPSNFQQKLKIAPFRLRKGVWIPQLRERFERWETLLGRENLTYRAYRAETLACGDLLTDFAGWAGIEPPDAAVRARRPNASMSAEATAILFVYRLRRGGVAENEWQRRATPKVINRLIAFRGSALRFSPDLVDAVVRDQADQIAWIEARLGVSVRRPMQCDDSATVIGDEDDLIELARDHTPRFLDHIGCRAALGADWQDALTDAIDSLHATL